MEAQEAQKEAIRLGSQRQKESFITDIASKGLFFSGKKTKGLKIIEADQLSNVLGIDRKFALLIAQGLETATQEIVKEAQKGRTEALDSLEALGFAIVGGKVVPTLQARKAQAQEERLFEQEQERTRQFNITQERLKAQAEVAQAQQAFNQSITLDQRRIAQANLEIAQAREARLALEDTTKDTGVKFDPTASEKSIAMGWLSQQEGITQEDYKKLETDPTFFYWALNKAKETEEEETAGLTEERVEELIKELDKPWWQFW